MRVEGIVVGAYSSIVLKARVAILVVGLAGASTFGQVDLKFVTCHPGYCTA